MDGCGRLEQSLIVPDQPVSAEHEYRHERCESDLRQYRVTKPFRTDNLSAVEKGEKEESQTCLRRGLSVTFDY